MFSCAYLLATSFSIQGIKKAEEIRVVHDLVDTAEEVREFVSPQKQLRFRKRDRTWFHGRRLIRYRCITTE